MRTKERLRRSACLSGYLPEKFALILHQGNDAYLSLEKRIEEAILQAVDDGYGSFICGMAKGFDLVAGSLVVTLKETWSGLAALNVVAGLPFERHGFSSEPWRTLHKMVLDRARCMVACYNGTEISSEAKEELWGKYYTGAPERQRQSVGRSRMVKRVWEPWRPVMGSTSKRWPNGKSVARSVILPWGRSKLPQQSLPWSRKR